MKKKKIIMIIVIFLIIIAFLIFLKTRKDFNSQSNVSDNSGINEGTELEKELLSQIKKCYQYYQESNAVQEDFYQYLNFADINEDFQNGGVSLVKNSYGMEEHTIQKYNINGEEISEFPMTYEDGREIVFEKNSSQIELRKILYDKSIFF